MKRKEKIKFIESYDYKVQIGTELVRVYDPLDKEGWKLVGHKKDLDKFLNETIEHINNQTDAEIINLIL